MKLLKDFYYWLVYHKLNSYIENRYKEKYTRKYPNWDYDKWIGDMEFIWGVKSWDDLTGKECNIHTMNDIEIDYCHDIKKYILSIETAYIFKDCVAECKYLNDCLSAIKEYMQDNKISTDINCNLFMKSISCNMEANSIEELYENFAIFVNGYCNINKIK